MPGPQPTPETDDTHTAPIDLDDSTARTTLRLPNALKAQVDEAVAADGFPQRGCPNCSMVRVGP